MVKSVSNAPKKIVTKKSMTKKSRKETDMRDFTPKMTIGKRTYTSTKIDSLVCGDCDVADIYQHVESEKPSGRFIVFVETDKMYGGFRRGRMGEYFSVKNTPSGRIKILSRIDWEDGINMIQSDGYLVWYVKHPELVKIQGYEKQPVRI